MTKSWTIVESYKHDGLTTQYPDVDLSVVEAELLIDSTKRHTNNVDQVINSLFQHYSPRFAMNPILQLAKQKTMFRLLNKQTTLEYFSGSVWILRTSETVWDGLTWDNNDVGYGVSQIQMPGFLVPVSATSTDKVLPGNWLLGKHSSVVRLEMTL